MKKQQADSKRFEKSAKDIVARKKEGAQETKCTLNILDLEMRIESAEYNLFSFISKRGEGLDGFYRNV